MTDSREYKARKLEAVRTGRVHADWSRPSEATLRAAEAQLAHRPADTRGLTARLMGDPEPWRSSLSMARSKTPDQPTDVRVRIGDPEGDEAAA